MNRFLPFSLIALPLLSCGSEQPVNYYELSWSFGYGNFWSSSPYYEPKDCTNLMGDWLSHPISQVVLTIKDPADKVRPYTKTYSCDDGFAPKSVQVFGFDKRTWLVEAEAQYLEPDNQSDSQSDNRVTPLYRLLPTMVDFSSPLTEPLLLHSLTGNFNFSFCFGSCRQMSCPEDVKSVELDLFKKDAAGSYPKVPDYSYKFTCEDLFDVQLVELDAEPINGNNILVYRLDARAVDEHGQVLYTAVDERPLKPGLDNLRDNMVLEPAK